MDKIAYYKEEIMEKAAQTKWRALIDSAKDAKGLSNTFSEFNRNKKVIGMNTPIEQSGIKELASLADKKKSAKQFLSKYNQKERQLPFMRQKAKDLSKEHKDIRLEVAHDNLDERKMVARKKTNHSMGIESGTKDPEEYMDIIHGTNRAKAKAFLQGGNGASKTESHMKLDNGKSTNMGIQVHSKVKGRAKGYADQQSGVRGGDSVELTGKVQRKYLYPNPSRGSGGGDEYGLPSIHHDKIKDGKIREI